jgi:TolB-like protein
MRLSPGERFERYVIESEIGAGGMGQVFRARDSRLQRPVAIKVLSSEIADPMARHRFEREALAASALNHPHIVTVYEAGETNGHPYLVTEIVEAGTLDEWAASTRPTWRQVADLMAGAADGLASAHAAGILHRDIKPQNILVTTSGSAKLADFGLATLAGEDAVDGGAATVTHLKTQPGVVVGTLAYMSPEQATGQRLDARSDIFSFGVVLYELLAGRRPFKGPTSVALLHAIAQDPTPPLPGDLPKLLQAIVEKALEKNPADRYQTMRDLVVDLRKVARQSAELPVGNVKSNRTQLVACAAVLIVIGVGSWAAFFRRGPGTAAAPVRSLAVLPLKPLAQGSNDADVGLGLADTIITRIGQIEGVTVRPTSAVRKYSAPDANALDAARELQVDVVLDGTLQRAGDRLRVNMLLVRVSDGATLWGKTFNTAFADVFAIEDEIATGVVSELRLSLSQAERMRLTKHHTASPEAYEYYLKGVATFSSVGSASANVTGNVDKGIELLERAVAIDPNYALAHAQLAWGDMWLASINGDEVAFARARKALARAEALDPNLAESYLVRYSVLMSSFSGFQVLPAFEALKKAQALNPNIGHYDLGSFYVELGLLEAGLRELRRALEIDPTNEAARSEIPNAYWINALYDDAIKANQALPRPVAWSYAYFVGAGRLDEARRMIDEVLAREPDHTFALRAKALLLAKEGLHTEARRTFQPFLPDDARGRTYHHATYTRACIDALAGDAEAAVHWLDETVKHGLPVYPAFARDTCFDPIRGSAQFTRFMTELKPVWDGYARRMQ